MGFEDRRTADPVTRAGKVSGRIGDSDWLHANLLPLLPFLLLGGTATLAAFYATRWGPWAFSDSVGYMISAQNLVMGKGLGLFKASGEFEALVSHPPLYPMAIAVLLKLGLEMIEAARWISSLTLGVFVSVIPWMYYRLKSGLGYAASLSLLLGTAPAIVIGFLGGMAETLFLSTGFMGLFALTLHYKKRSSGWLFASAVLLALSILSRYPALAFVLGACSYVVLRTKDTLGDRIRKVLLISGSSALGLASFLLWSRLSFGGGAPRAAQPGFHATVPLTDFFVGVAKVAWEWKPIPPASVIDFIMSSAWIQPLRIGLALGLVSFALLAVTSMIIRWRVSGMAPPHEERSSLSGLMGLTLGWYLVILAIAFFYSFPTPDIDSRTLLPVLITGIIFTASVIQNFEPAAASGPIHRGSRLGLLAVVLVGNGLMSFDIFQGMHRTGSGYTSQSWRASETIQAVATISKELPLISNAPEAVLLHQGRYPHDLAQLLPEEIGRGCPAELEDLLSDRAVVLLFSDDTPRRNGRTPESYRKQLIDGCDLEPIAEFQDGTLLERPE